MADDAMTLLMPVLRALLMDLDPAAAELEPAERRAPRLRLLDGPRRDDGALDLDLSHLPEAAGTQGATWQGVEELVDATVDALLPPLQSYVDAHGRLPGELRLSADRHIVVDAGNAVNGDPLIRPAVDGKVAVVTGGAQGFGAEIARGLARAGAYLVLADLNLPGAEAMAGELNALMDRPVAEGREVDVSDETSVAELIRGVTERVGGIDLFISNAGVLKAGSVKELSVEDFDFVTSVNYKGFFICSKQVSRLMSTQDRARMRVREMPLFGDIIQINSKSGLDGSNKNGAYAGSKFGGIGLVQSFAKELVENHIKVNAVCPGNFFYGPLWSDPDRGLFVQYLRAGKVPGAKSVADVKSFYESRVPMGRGCTGPDVVRAILYAVGQRYETGQAIPVTGGQIMLS